MSHPLRGFFITRHPCHEAPLFPGVRLFFPAGRLRPPAASFPQLYIGTFCRCLSREICLASPSREGGRHFFTGGEAKLVFAGFHCWEAMFHFLIAVLPLEFPVLRLGFSLAGGFFIVFPDGPRAVREFPPALG
jgi:hypothetical protein